MTSDFKKLTVWREAMKLAKQIYLLTEAYPNSENYCLVSQMRRCAVSIPSNIAEGQGRNSSGEFIQFLRIARGSSTELETQVLLSLMLNYIDKEKCDDVAGRIRLIQIMLTRLIRSLKE